LKNYFLRGRHNLVVTGTHGKTTTTALLTWIMDFAKRAPSYMIGGIRAISDGARDSTTLNALSSKAMNMTQRFRQTLKVYHYLPELLVVNNVEFDHADIFSDLDAIKQVSAVW